MTRLPAHAFATVTALALWITPALAAEPALRSVFQDDFTVGVALGSRVIGGRQAEAGELAAKQFSSLTPENEMKWQALHPAPDRYRFEAADAFVDFARRHRMELVGHALVWHSQTPAWVFQDKDGQALDREALLARMRGHIHTVVGRYRGKIKGWDVVNEALSDGGPDLLRDSPWRRIIGDDYLDHAFRYAREADPQAELYYNDYGLEDPRKRENCLKLLRAMRERGVPIDGVGTQSHFHLRHPPLEEIEKTITALAGLGLKVMVTELDVDVLPSRGDLGIADINRRQQADPALDPYRGPLPDPIQEELARRYSSIFEIYLRHRKSITRVTFWGLDDGRTWLNHFPIRGRTNHPLLFDRDLNPKPAFHAVVAQKLAPPPPPKAGD
jgi:endo-1,4-beta-xylanase